MTEKALNRKRIISRLVRAAALIPALAFTLAGCGLIPTIAPVSPSGTEEASASPTESGSPSAAVHGLSGVVLNEAVASNSGSFTHEVYGTPDWLELKNTSDEKTDISGWRLDDSPSMETALTFPEGTVLEPGGIITVLCVPGFSGEAVQGEFIAPFGVSRSGETLRLEDTLQKTVLFELPSLPEDVSWALGAEGRYGYALPTFGKENGEVYASAEELPEQAEDLDGLRITEIVNGPEGWVELENITDRPIELSQYTLTDDEAEPAKWRFPLFELEPGGFITVELTGGSEGPFYTSFKVSRSENAVFLFNSSGKMTSKLEFETPLPAGVSAVAAEGGAAYTAFPTKGEANSERTFAALKWTDMDINDPDSVLILNEVLADNKYGIVDSYGDRSDWVELLNTSDGPVYLEGYYLSDDPEDPMKWQLPKVALLPHEYAVIFLSGNESTGGEIHAPFRLSAGESVYLSRLDGMKRDSLAIPEGINPNVSVGRGPGNAVLYYAAPTPGERNDTYGNEKYADAGGFNARSVYISEVCAVTAPGSGESDWIELYNGGGSSQSLKGWSLTDDLTEPRKYTFGSVKLAAGDYSVISSSRTGFSISNSGETLYLFDSEGAVRDVFSTGMTTLGMTSGRENGSENGERRFFTKATKGYKNSAPLSGCAAEPRFSRTGLYAGSAFDLRITCSTEGAEIRYTTDGSDPTKDSKRYTGPIRISGNTVIKARAFREGMAASPAAVQTFIFGKEHTLPVVSISLSREDYSRMYTSEMNENGAVVKGDEVACFMEYFVDGKLAISSGAGVRVSGASTSVYPQKSLGLYFRAGYGRSSLDYPLFSGCKTSSFRSLVLRNSGQDASYARIRDSFVSMAAKGFNVDYASFRPVIVYINGDYRGIYDMKENLNEDYLVSHKGAARSNVEIARRNGYMTAGKKALFKEMLEMCTTLDFSVQENFDKLAKLVDTDSIIDYLILRTYFYDGDMFNQKYWHTTDNKVKWRAVLYDSDCAMLGCNASASILSSYFDPNGVSSAHSYITQMDIFCALNQNKKWRDEFITRYIYAVEYKFTPEKMLGVFDSLAAQYRPEMKAHIQMWHMPYSYEAWEKELSSLRSCIQKRPSYALNNLKSFYGLSESSFAEYERLAKAMAKG